MGTCILVLMGISAVNELVMDGEVLGNRQLHDPVGFTQEYLMNV